MRFVNINPKWPDGMADKRVESVAPRGGGWGMINAAEIAFGFASNSYKGGSPWMSRRNPDDTPRKINTTVYKD